MAKLLKGAETAEAIRAKLQERITALQRGGITPCLAVVRMGARDDDLSYERGIVNRCEKLGIAVRRIGLAEEAPQEALEHEIDLLNQDNTVHGILLFSPLPAHIDAERARERIDAQKDVDGATSASAAALYAGKAGFVPCTAAACLAILRHYGIPMEGKRAVVIGRSEIVGKPAALLLLQENATVTVCHSRTQELPSICREADILIVAAGKAGMLGAEHVRAGQTVLDVGIHAAPEGGLCGDVRFEEVEPIVEAITPVPGGVGAVTNILLSEHVVDAAEHRR